MSIMTLSPLARQLLRVARPTDRLERSAFYRDGPSN